jgi:phosphoribosylformylglycinamidine (FGAM) synthase PurS component
MRHSRAAVLGVVLIFFGIMLLSHMPISMMAREKVEAQRIANMSSCESNNPNATEVDGICFESLVPEEMVRLPKYEEEIPVQFGVRITNQASIPYRFDLPFVLPEILDPHGNAMQRSLNKNATREVGESDIPLIRPGESLEFLMDAKFSWYDENCLRLLDNAIYGGIWIFWYIQPGKYQVRFTYENQLAKKKMITLKEGRTEIYEFWTGKLMSHFADFILR